uniref:Uncharacterized protein n=1 Tax=Corethron hystrix TaxID=216773 RepID=A0A7S1BI15_9STRA|mmetsp:Transcript_28816/g.65937  ORF Transcript_28816/g.65937 Transcript_28816/m.65937 type:complete len:157 (+) Transcript_28816:57-527(+)
MTVRILLPLLGLSLFIGNDVYALKELHDGSCLTCKATFANHESREKSARKSRNKPISTSDTLRLAYEFLDQVRKTPHPEITGDDLIDRETLSRYYKKQNKVVQEYIPKVDVSIEDRVAHLSHMTEIAQEQNILEENGFVPHPDYKDELLELQSRLF